MAVGTFRRLLVVVVFGASCLSTTWAARSDFDGVAAKASADQSQTLKPPGVAKKTLAKLPIGSMWARMLTAPQFAGKGGFGTVHTYAVAQAAPQVEQFTRYRGVSTHQVGPQAGLPLTGPVVKVDFNYMPEDVTRYDFSCDGNPSDQITHAEMPELPESLKGVSQVAVKHLPYGTDREKEKFQIEVDQMSRFVGRRFIKKFASLHEDNDAWIVMEAASGDLRSEVIGQHRKIKATTKARLFLEIVEGVEQIHSNHHLHCDIKPDNILITGSILEEHACHAKIADLGLVCDTTQMKMNPGILRGTLLYLPGRLLPHDQDIWGLGVLLHEMFWGRLPKQIASGCAVTLKGSECQQDIIDTLASDPLWPLPQTTWAFLEPLATKNLRALMRKCFEEGATVQDVKAMTESWIKALNDSGQIVYPADYHEAVELELPSCPLPRA